MPEIRDLGLATNPSLEPVHYPGRLVREDGLLVGSWLYSLRGSRGMPVGRWPVSPDGGPLGSGTTPLRLDDALGRLGASLTAERHPVLAVGSNASPGQLVHKFTGTAGGAVIPLTAARVLHLGVAHSAHVARAGYVPYAPAHDPGTRRRLVVLWLDRGQLIRLDATEPNYTSLTLAGPAWPAQLEASGEQLGRFSLYRSRWGVLGSPATTQDGLFSVLAALPWFADLVPAVRSGTIPALDQLRADENLRLTIRRTWAAEGMSRPDRLGDSPLRPRTHGGGPG